MVLELRNGQAWHPMMPEISHDEMSRQLFAQAFMTGLQGGTVDGNRIVWEHKGKREFVAYHGREPRHISEVRKWLLNEPYTKYWSTLKRCARDLSYESAGPMVERQLDELISRARHYRDSNRKLGTLELDPSLRQPAYMERVENHAKPGGYHSDLTEDDVFAGAEYDRTFHLSGSRPALLAAPDKVGALTKSGRGYGPLGDDMGRALARWVEENVPELEPTRILDMGCTVGHSTLPWTSAFPRAEIHAIDVAAPCLRYGHARAEALGAAVHFSQQNAERTRYAEESFDIVVSHLLMHELSLKAIHNVFAESHRLLKPGGLMMHLDVPPAREADLMAQRFQLDWNTHFNAEPFITKLMELDLAEVAVKGGFAHGKTFHARAQSSPDPMSMSHHFFGARK